MMGTLVFLPLAQQILELECEHRGYDAFARLVMSKNMEKVINAVNHLGIAVRSLFGEGSDANGSIFQISNQQTLGESESAIIERLNSTLESLVKQENNAREKLCKMTGIGLLIK